MNNENLESRLLKIEQGAVAFRVLAMVFLLLGVVLSAVTILTAAGQLRSELPFYEVALGLTVPGANSVGSFMMFWFLGRTSTLFLTTAALMREMREVV